MNVFYLLTSATVIYLYNTANFGIRSKHLYISFLVTVLIGYVAYNQYKKNEEQLKSIKKNIYPLIIASVILIYESFYWYGGGKTSYHSNLSVVTLLLVGLATYFIYKELKTKDTKL